MSSKPSKQRKALWKAPIHRRRKFLAAPLSMELKVKFGRKAVPVRDGDSVQIKRGDYTSLEGKVKSVDLRKQRITVEGVTTEKADGTTVLVPIHPSKVIIKKLNLDDKWRSKRLSAKPEA